MGIQETRYFFDPPDDTLKLKQQPFIEKDILIELDIGRKPIFSLKMSVEKHVERTIRIIIQQVFLHDTSKLKQQPFLIFVNSYLNVH